MTDPEIYEQLRDPLMRFAASLVGRGDAHDLVADAVTATLARHQLSTLENPKAYLMQAVLNNARSQNRTRTREQRALSQLAASVASGDELQVDSTVVSAVGKLPIQQRAAIYLVYWEDMAPTDAARVMGVRPATLRRYIHLAREKMRGQLRE